jgi:hypothetical protein
MRMTHAVLAVVAISVGSLSSASASDPAVFKTGWKKLAEGVFERHELDGSITRVGLGQGGASYDRSLLAGEIARLSSLAANAVATDSDKSALAIFRADQESIPTKVANAVVPKSSSTGTVCDSIWYSLDSHFAVGKGGATPVSRAQWGFTLWGPQPPFPTSVSLYARSSLTPSGGSAITVTKTGSLYSDAPVAIVDWKKAIWDGDYVSSSSCSASTYTTFTVNDTSCSGGTAFVSLSKSYPTCTGSL